jgi:CheY-like chemotaxis protein
VPWCKDVERWTRRLTLFISGKLTIKAEAIVLVDDEADARELLRYLLDARGARVTVASAASEALRLITAEPFDVLIADGGMPEQDGYALIRTVRGLSESTASRIPAIAVTACAGLRDRNQALQAGFNRHLPTPVDPEQLIDCVAEGIAARVTP